ncbi:MAG: STAS domain-containing protein [Alphaproteobacteria bacterium]|nr:STAS domain-containing protein [Candidatus Jidaibacter sp.]
MSNNSAEIITVDTCYSLESMLDIISTEKLYKEIITIVEKSESICIDASKVSKISTPAIQIILALDIFMESCAKSLVIQSPSEAFLSGFQDLGLGSSTIMNKLIYRS